MSRPPLTIDPPLSRSLRYGFGLFLALAAPCAVTTTLADATIWNGPLTTFTEPAGGTGTSPADQDRITPGVWLTRNTTQGLYNAATETGFTAFVSPADTKWAYGTLANYASLTYTDWEDWTGHNPPSIVDQQAVLHLVNEDIYMSVEFLSWGIRGSGGFSYLRSTASVPEPSSAALLVAALAFFRVWRLSRR